MSKNLKEKTKSMKDEQKKKPSQSKTLIDRIKRQTKDINFDIEQAKKDINRIDITKPSELKTFAEGDNLPKWSINYIQHIWKTEIKKASTILVRMVLRNGKINSFVVTNSNPLFTFQNGNYIIDSSRITTDVATGQATLLFHQDLSLPLNLLMDVEKVKQGVYNDKDFEEIAQNINPDVLKSTVTSTLIKQVMAGGLLDKQLRSVIIIMVINLVLTIILLVGVLINGFMA